MTFGTLIIYIWLIATAAFVIWRMITNPITQIHDGVLDGDIEKVRQCLEKGVDADIQKGQGVTPICLAVSKGNKEIVELLVDYGANINQGLSEEDGVNPLLEAGIKDYPELVDFFLSRGAIVGIHFAALQGNIDAVRNFIQQNVPINSTRNRGMTPLHLAAQGGHREIVNLLLDNGADINFYTPASETPLHCAIRCNHSEIVELLMDSGADTATSGGFGTPLCLAVFKNNQEIVELLVRKGADVNETGKRGFYPLHFAAGDGYVEVARFLLANGAQVNTHDNFNGKTPLHLSVSKNNLEMAELLIRNGADVNSISWFGMRTPLAGATSREMVSLLKGYGAINII